MRSRVRLMEYIVKMEEITGKKFGDKENPLLVSVTFWCKSIYAGYDGYHLKSWSE